MKALLSLIISGALVVSGFGQTRNVLVGTNNAVVQPTNFWSADASNARTGLGLGTAATNPASAFQPASSALTNLVSGNGGALTNLQATNLVGLIPTSNIPSIVLTSIGTITIQQGGTGATNAANARQNLGSTTVGDAVFIATNAAAARTAIGATTVGSSLFTLANPSAITFLRLNADNTVSALSASDFRTALSLGTAATNPSSAFQPASSALTNLSTNNGVNLTNIPVAGVVGALSTNGNGAGLTNLTAANITGTVALASNVTGTIAISNGGSGATTAGGARTNFGLGNISTNTFQTTNTAIYINTNLVATNGVVFVTNINGGYFEGNWIQVNDGTNGITFETDVVAAITRTNLGIGAGATNTVGFGKIISSGNGLSIEEPASPATIIGFPSDIDPVVLGADYWNHGSVRQSLGFSTNLSNFWTSASIAAGRTNLGLPLAALTNTNNADFLAAFFGANTNPVLVNTNGEVVSPTNFWQEAPITTTFIESQPTTNSSTNISPSRLLHIHSLATNVVNTTNTIILPTNALTFEGDMALVVHKGPTNSLTQVRQAGSTNNLITLNKFNEAVEFTYYNDTWQFLETASFTAPIYFSGTNAVSNAAESRTNLGLGATNEVSFDDIQINESGEDPVFVKNESGAIQLAVGTNETSVLSISDTVALFNVHLDWANTTNAATTRTNLGLPLDALTNTSVTNFQKAIFYTNTAPSNIGGNLGTIAAWIEIVASNGVTYKIPAYTNVP